MPRGRCFCWAQRPDQASRGLAYLNHLPAVQAHHPAACLVVERDRRAVALIEFRPPLQPRQLHAPPRLHRLAHRLLPSLHQVDAGVDGMVKDARFVCGRTGGCMRDVRVALQGVPTQMLLRVAALRVAATSTQGHKRERRLMRPATCTRATPPRSSLGGGLGRKRAAKQQSERGRCATERPSDRAALRGTGAGEADNAFREGRASARRRSRGQVHRSNPNPSLSDSP